jgi:hypothetical protein
MRQRTILFLAFACLLALLAGYVYIYQTGPFSQEWNDSLLLAADPLGALLAALAVTAVLSCYRRADRTYVVWLCFTIAIWSWSLGEITYSALSLLNGELPRLSLADVFWFVGNGFFSIALRSQYQLVYQTRISWLRLIAIWVGMLAVAAAALLLVGRFLTADQFTFDNFVEYLYAVVDFGMCLASIRLFMTFGAGKLARPWLALLVMGISDTMYALLTASGQYQVSSDAGTWLSVFTDTSYLAAYLLFGFGFLAQYLLLRFGPEG